MKKSKRLLVVLELARRDEEKAAKDFESARTHYQGEVQKLQDLEKYYDDYASKFQAQTQGLRGSDIANARSLLQQIVMVQQGQKLQIHNAQNAMEKSKQIWHKNHLKFEKLQELIRRYQVEEALAEDKQEQKIIDEWVSQTHGQQNTRYQ
ncbi:hypothetical protein TDB9533_02068 [Thalassocella blandensis]|nr:hypothetical protein TDB9533_02068 [Thalassocella blandensis]